MPERYSITGQNLPGHEWIGLECTVVHSTDPCKKGMRGKIVDETRNTVKIETKQGEKILPKKEVELEIALDNQKTILKTGQWCFAPENRVKEFFKKKGKKQG